MTTLAAVDIGSNAIRIHICHLLEEPEKHSFKTLEYLRIPLRLGEDVFTTGLIGEGKKGKLVKLGQSLSLLFELYGVDRYLCCATSAMREAKNRQEVVEAVRSGSGFEIQIIEGEREAEWTNLGLQAFLGDGCWLHVDVGGGSTEINLYLNREKVASHSFRIGAVRIMMKEDTSAAYQELVEWIKQQILYWGHDMPVTSLGTGGNIAKIHQMTHLKDHESISLDQIKACAERVGSYTLEDRIRVLKLNPDRADVLLPSSSLYIAVMETAGSVQMFVPKVGLTDGMLEILRTT